MSRQSSLLTFFSLHRLYVLCGSCVEPTDQSNTLDPNDEVPISPRDPTQKVPLPLTQIPIRLEIKVVHLRIGCKYVPWVWNPDWSLLDLCRIFEDSVSGSEWPGDDSVAALANPGRRQGALRAPDKSDGSHASKSVKRQIRKRHEISEGQDFS